MDKALLNGSHPPHESQQQHLFTPDTLPSGFMPWELAAEEDQWVAHVVFNRPLEAVYPYLVPDELRETIRPGQRIRAPFGKGNRKTVGYCVGLGPVPKTNRNLKTVESVIDRDPLISPTMLELTRWIADRYVCGWGQVLDAVIPGAVKRNAGTRVIKLYQAAPGVAEKLPELALPSKQRSILEVLCRSGGPMRVEELTEAAGCGTAPLRALREKGLIQAIRERTETFQPDDVPVESRTADFQLNSEQQSALDAILAALRGNEQQTFLLHGVTGSGKTEVYIQAIRECLEYGRQAIVLVPEISLTPQTIRRFRERFDSVAVLHSHLTDAERHWYWQQIERGAVQVVVGARSAVFAPTSQLGLIIIDEEHETSFKQDSTPRYHARDVARARARLENVPLILGSATPTLESWLRSEQKKDVLLSLSKRVEEYPLPPVVTVDIRNDPQHSRGEAIGRALESAMRSALTGGGQVILFLNLRGYSPTLWCRSCGTSVKCPNCDITLTWHKDRDVALCHSCDYRTAVINCPGCHGAGIRYLGAGTQRLEQEVRAKFPDHRCLRMDSDSMRRPGAHDAALEAFRLGEVQILLGTQMIAKGLDFPNVTLVGVVSADTILNQPDFRARERTLQLISQVAGRTGRSSRGGRVFVQSSSPAELAIVKASEHDFVGFAAEELRQRRNTLFPPYQQLARVILRGPDEQALKRYAAEMAEVLADTSQSQGAAVRILGPAPCPVAKLKGNYRYHFQLNAQEFDSIRQLWRQAARRFPKSQDIEFTIDIDPINMR